MGDGNKMRVEIVPKSALFFIHGVMSHLLAHHTLTTPTHMLSVSVIVD